MTAAIGWALAISPLPAGSQSNAPPATPMPQLQPSASSAPTNPLNPELKQYLESAGRRAIHVREGSSIGGGEAATSAMTAITNPAVPAGTGWSFEDSPAAIEDARMDRVTRRIDDGGLGPERRSRTGNPVTQGIEAVFTPETIRWGRAQVGFSPYTAVKRRNPFCLLNPIPLSLSW